MDSGLKKENWNNCGNLNMDYILDDITESMLFLGCLNCTKVM